MRVEDLIRLLELHKQQYGPDAQIAVPRSRYGRTLAAKGRIIGTDHFEFGEEIFLQHGSIATYLDSRGLEVQW
jgi:hypothetical protein